MIDHYGTWKSPVVAEWLTMSQKRYGTIVLDGTDIYWDEMRPNENGRSVVVKRSQDGTKQDVTPEGFSVRSRVHEYGGSPFTVFDGKVYFVNDKDQRVYLEKEPLTEAGIRCADLHIQLPYLVAVAEKGDDNFLIAVDLNTKQSMTMASGHDFYASPTFFGSKIAFLTWDHPNMPWDGTDLWVGNFHNGQIEGLQKVAGSQTESIFQPQWSPSGALYFVTDKSGWWNLLGHPDHAEYGLPQWVFGMSTYAFAGDEIVAASVKNGIGSLSYQGERLDLPWTYFTQVRATENQAVFIAGSGSEGKSIVSLNLLTGKAEVIEKNAGPHLDSGYVSIPEFITYPSGDGRHSHAFYYPPKNKDFTAPHGTLPPLLVLSHGGPTAATDATLRFSIQYWTTRGFAVLDVNYGGSTGYGRPYRDSLKGKWGIVDVEDCAYGAQYLIDQKKVNPSHIAISGGSAGGFTTLAALIRGAPFTVGASYYGVSDLTALATETHKFESRYLDSLIGPYPAEAELYKERSPLSHVEKLRCPVIFFQGDEDKVVPPNQSEKMYEALKSRSILTDYILYAGEQHGFRKAENIKDSLEKELAFYLKAWKISTVK